MYIFMCAHEWECVFLSVPTKMHVKAVTTIARV